MKDNDALAELNADQNKWLDRHLSPDGRIRSFAKYCPLIAATFAPFSTLMDIPALSERWYYIDGQIQPDYKACIALSALGLGLNLIANVLLLIRFSASKPGWSRYSTLFSTFLWIGKTAVALLNLAIFGALITRKPGYSFSEGFWCAVVSVIVAGTISLALLLHFLLGYDIREEENPLDVVDVRAEGRKFMLSVTVFMVVLGFQSLAFSRIEHWSYSDAIYFSTQTALTIGYGDLVPTTTAGKVLVFIFSVLTISQLGNEIALIISFMQSRAEVRREKWRKKYEEAMHREANLLRPKATLLEEMSLIYEINSREELMNQIVDLMWSAISLVIFWVAGAAIFNGLEGWGYGNAVYAVMVLSLTIGFGDYTPTTPAGRIVFVVYALMAVPIVTSFAVQTITGLLSTYSNRGEIRDRFRRDRQRNPQAFMAHSDFILHAHESYAEMRVRLLGEKIEAEKVDPTYHERKSRMMGQASSESEPPSAESSSSQTVVTASEADTRKQRPHIKTEGLGAVSSPMIPVMKAHARHQTKHTDNGKRKQLDHHTSAPLLHPGSWRDIMKEEKDRIEEHWPDKPLNEIENMVQKAHRDVEAIISSRNSRPSSFQRIGSDPKEEEAYLKDEAKAQELETEMLKKLMKLVIQLEAEARQMLLDSMEKGVARMLLRADRNVQERDVRAVRGDDADMIAIWRGVDKENEENHTRFPSMSNSMDLLSKVSRYRNTFATILVLGSILQRLSGDDLKRFERWQEHQVGEAPVSPTDRSRSSPRSPRYGPLGSLTDEPVRGSSEDDEGIRGRQRSSFSGLTKLIFDQHSKQLRKASTEEGSLKLNKHAAKRAFAGEF
ncbi:hypothetical protein BD324DRAFT_653796 [Kockovaella imperatae]|uniref:Potassium channel domain-containing protein n=1 Tax=Kockovaella imperatae TaxID=4999 RepID=A0A1Y1U6X0_9TREE|nr:hypothetical protein BD324DRAFT_653796 [Kockovaella imperatae]ORX33742.1 hypothetical protein BD324DRAFT_653796 [Kockovaella imperatae]